MSNPRYLEVDSTYRNRNDWPLAADFQIPIAQTGRKGTKRRGRPRLTNLHH